MLIYSRVACFRNISRYANRLGEARSIFKILS
nr:MAG TPA: hypothetical protein [Caudoviricetes sp.]